VSATPNHCSRHVLLLPCLWCDCTAGMVAVLLVQCLKLLCVASSLTCTWQHLTLALHVHVVIVCLLQCKKPRGIPFAQHPRVHASAFLIQLRILCTCMYSYVSQDRMHLNCSVLLCVVDRLATGQMVPVLVSPMLKAAGPHCQSLSNDCCASNGCGTRSRRLPTTPSTNTVK
jgi:hypothetical protein